MAYLNMIVALLLPVLLGTCWVALIVPPTTPGRLPLVWGSGVLAGLLVIPILMRLLSALGLPPGFYPAAMLAAALLLVALTIHKHRTHLSPAVNTYSAPTASVLSRVLLLCLCALLMLRVVGLGIELVLHPLFPWDATMHWSTKSRVWFELGMLAPFVENDEWLRRAGEAVYTDHHPDYPATIPLLQLWMSSALGRWDESLMNLPWWLCYMAMGSGFYGQARVAGATRNTALFFTYLLLSMPLLNTHVALAGYADLFLGACYGAAIMALSNWSQGRQQWQGVLALFFGLCCMLIKNEGVYWFFTLIPAVALVLIPFRRLVVIGVAGAALLIVAVMLMPQDLVFAGHTLEGLNIGFRDKTPQALATSIYFHDSWHLLGYMLSALLVTCLLNYRQVLVLHFPALAALACALVLCAVLFTWTKYASGAVGFTAVGRIGLHLVPSLTFISLLLWLGIRSYSRGSPSGNWSGFTGK